MNTFTSDSIGSLPFSSTLLPGITVPAASSSRCLGCDAEIVRYGDDDVRYCAACSKCPSCGAAVKLYDFDAVKICDDCLDCLEGLKEVAATPGHRHKCCCDDGHDHEEAVESADIVLDPADSDDAVPPVDLDGLDVIWGDVVADDSMAADEADCCATCATTTQYRCKCGKLCCVDCVDEVGRCPACDGEV